MITKGMILAAGYGTRLRPLTDKTPKPLVEVGDLKIIEYNLKMMAASGIKEVVINLHHLASMVEKFLGDGSRYNLKISYSLEKEILGTGGGIRNASDSFGGESFVVVNCDVLTALNLAKVCKFHEEKNLPATLVLKPLEKEFTFTPIEVLNDQLISFGRGDFFYTGVQIINPSLLERLPLSEPSDLVGDLYLPLLSEGGTISTYIYDGFWTEIGTIESLEAARTQISGLKSRFWYL